MIDIRGTVAMTRAKSFDKPLVIYGSGNTGRAVAKHLERQGRNVVAFVDQKGGGGQSCLQRPLLSLLECTQSLQTSGLDVLVAIHNRDVEMPPLIRDLSTRGFSDVLTMIDYINAFPDDGTSRYWLSPRSTYLDDEADVYGMFALMEDEQSKYWVDRILRFRITGDYSALPYPDRKNQYVSPDLPRWTNPLRFIDCGAFTGDTIELLLAVGYEVERILAFEPDPENFAQLAETFTDRDRIFIPCGVASSNCSVQFTTGAGEGSHRVEAGGVSVQMVRIDDVAAGFGPNLIKMDIEGGELDAMKGARSTISRFKPGLALSLYHRPEDLWRIPLLIHDWNLGYRFFVRGHGNSSFESVLYAMVC